MFTFLNLDARTRQLMLAEVERDEQQESLFISDRLTGQGRTSYKTVLKDAIQDRDPEWLADQFRDHGWMESTERRRKPNGGFSIVKVPVNAPETLAEGEFNRFYARALCRRAQEDGVPNLVVYRAKPVSQPRWESEQKIGQAI